MSKRNGEKKVSLSASIEQPVDKWLDDTVGDIGSKAALVNKILKEAMLKDTQTSQEGD